MTELRSWRVVGRPPGLLGARNAMDPCPMAPVLPPGLGARRSSALARCVQPVGLGPSHGG